MAKRKYTKGLLSELERLAEAGKTGDFNVALDSNGLSAEEAAAVELLKEAFINFKNAMEYDLMKYKLTGEALGVALWDMDVVKGDPINPGNKFTWSQEFRHMLGFSNEQDFPNELGSWSNRIHPEDREGALAAFAAHLNDRSAKTPFDVEYRLQQKNGNYRSFRAFGTTKRDSGGLPLRSAGALEDISERKRIREALSRRETMLNALNEMAVMLLSQKGKTFDDVMSDALMPIAGAVKLDQVDVYRYAVMEGKDCFSRIYSWDRETDKAAARKGKKEILPDIPLTRDWISVLSKGGIINLHTGALFEEEAEFLNERGVKSILLTPVFNNDEFWGGVAFQDHANERYFDEEYLDMLHSVAHLCAGAVVRSETEREMSEKNESNQVLFHSAPIGLTMFDSDCGIIDCNDAVLAIFGVTKEYYLHNFYSLSPEYQPDGSKSHEKMRELMTRTLEGSDVKTEWMHCLPNLDPIPCEITLTRTKQEEKYVGLKYVYDLRQIKKLERDIQWFEAEASKIYFDPLTGIYNRRYFDENFNFIIKSLSRSKSALSLMMIDIDFFKRYNDTYGHGAGDVCLKTIAETLSETVTRDTDFIARYGGEEFAVVLSNTREEGARFIAERLLENIRNCAIPHEKNDAADCVTVSIGVASGMADYKLRGEDYIKRADELMYQSKQNGRNQYTFGRF